MSSAHPDETTPDHNPQKELLAEAAAALRAEQEARDARRPKNVGQGAVGLVGDSLGGAALGAAAIVLGPVQGYKQAGPKGILGGALGGLAVGVASTTYGIGSGIGKFVQGTSRTLASFHNRDLPEKLRVGVQTQLVDFAAFEQQKKQLYGELIDESNRNGLSGTSTLQPPIETELYQALDLDVDANPAQIRKAYYKMAQRFHPDKHPDDPQATAKFQKISEAYQVLSDPVKREEYHRLGASATNEGEMVDPKALFALMFSDFEHIVGDLATATILQSVSLDGKEESPEVADARKQKRKEFQQTRESHLVKLLEKRCEPWLSGDEAAFIEHAKLEVQALRAQPFGREVLRTAAYIYKKKASRVLDHGKSAFTGMSQFFEDIGDKAHGLKSQMRALEGGLKALSEHQATDEDESIDQVARREAVSTLGAVWLASVVDIEKTLMHVVSAFLGSLESKKNAKNPVVLNKAQALLILSQIFEQA